MPVEVFGEDWLEKDSKDLVTDLHREFGVFERSRPEH
jgi:hypothetical protein